MTSTIPFKINGIDFNKVLPIYRKENVIESSIESAFNRLPNFKEVLDVEISDRGETIFRFKGNNFIVMNKTIE